MDRLIYTALSGLRARDGAPDRRPRTTSPMRTRRASAPRCSRRRRSGCAAQGCEPRAPVVRARSPAPTCAPASINQTGRDLDVAMQRRCPARRPGRGRQRSLYPPRRPSGQRERPASPPATAAPCSAKPARSPCRRRIRSGSPTTARSGSCRPGGDASQPQQVDRLKLVSPTGSHIAQGRWTACSGSTDGGALPSDPQARVIPAQPRKLQRQGQPDPDRHDRRQPRPGTRRSSSSPRRATSTPPPPI